MSNSLKQIFNIVKAYEENYDCILSVNGTSYIKSYRAKQIFDSVYDIHIGMIMNVPQRHWDVRIIDIHVVPETRIMFIAYVEVSEDE